MCGRSSLTKQEKEIEARFNATFYTEELERYNPLPNYNVAPTNIMPAITQEDPTIIQLYRWGLIPSWAKDTKIGAQMINARVETLIEKAAFKKLITNRRCIMPLDGFYEWRREGKEKIPFRISTSDQEIFSVAGLWDMWRDPVSGHEICSFTMITLPANQMMSTIHDRMPAILRKENEVHWLSNEIPQQEIMDLIQPYPSENMHMYRVSNKVNSVREQGADLIDPYKPDEGKPQQLSLF
jgi:putative SOS response-associated peptidase YedK